MIVEHGLVASSYWVLASFTLSQNVKTNAHSVDSTYMMCEKDLFPFPAYIRNMLEGRKSNVKSSLPTNSRMLSSA